MTILQSDCTYLSYFADTRCAMNDVENFNSFGSNAVYYQVGVENNVAVHAAFGGKMAAFGIIRIIFGKHIQMLPYDMPVTFCLKVSEGFISKIIYLFKTFVEFVAYFNLLARYFVFHVSNLRSNSSSVIKFPVSI